MEAPGSLSPVETYGPVIDVALFRLRRIWARPFRTRRTGDRPLQISNVMVVHALAKLSAAPAEVTVGAVAEHMDIDPSTASRFVNDAIGAGLAERLTSEVDARRARLILTEKGRRVLDAVTRYRRDYIEGLIAGWSEEDRDALARLLTRLAEASSRRPIDLSGLDPIVDEIIRG
ncbi:MarR family winged helix-turn-helix transcriptional regulator [Thermopolyspora sp. NPDC052614]|uniref:MarR family winged helix-turn-helix transcriptional regulator n=1 Tax=Thermopolyspora sp. NPDC052614 TaxID=3155682 RepID=UPI00344A8D68